MAETVDFALLHGAGQGSWVWADTIAAMEAQRDARLGRVAALDVPGCGSKRDRDISSLTMDDIAAELIADIEAAGLTRAVLVGHSQGGTVLPLMLRRRPDLFGQAIYLTACAPKPGQTIRDMVGSSKHGENPDETGCPLDPKIVDPSEQFALMFCSDMDETQTSAFLARLGKDMWPMDSYSARNWSYEGLLTTPSTYVICLRDNSLTAHWQEIFAKRLNVDRLTYIDCGHQAMNTRPHGLAEILRHLGRVEPRP